MMSEPVAIPDLMALSEGWRVDFATMPDGWPLRWAFWQTTQPMQGHVLILSGRPEPLEYYPEIAAHYADMGYAAVFLERRGQGLSGRVLKDAPLKDHIESFETHLADISHFCTRIFEPMAKGGKTVLHGHSMGGHLALRHAGREGGFTRVVVSSPLAGLPRTLLPHALERNIIDTLGQKWPTAYGYRQNDDDPAKRVFEGNPHTSDYAAWQARIQVLMANPALRMGGVTWGWVKAAQVSCDALLAREAALISVPVLLHLATQDKVVSPAAQQTLVAQLRCARIERYAKARHEILGESPAIRRRLWDATAGFLRGSTP